MDNSLQNNLANWIQSPSLVPADAIPLLEELLKRYPYFQLGYTLLLSAKKNSAATLQVDELAQASIYALDRSTLQQIMEGENPWKRQSSFVTSVLNNSEIEEHPKFATEVGEFSEASINEVVLLDDLLSVAVPLEERKLDQKQLQIDLIEKFIKNDPKIRPVKDLLGEGNEVVDLSVFAEKPLNSLTLATESFAKILEKQGKFYKSIEIYEKLILKNPEKKDYFAKKIKELSSRIDK